MIRPADSLQLVPTRLHLSNIGIGMSMLARSRPGHVSPLIFMSSRCERLSHLSHFLLLSVYLSV